MCIVRTMMEMAKKEKISSVLQLIGGRPENVEIIVEEIDKFFDQINAELEDWKFSMEERPEGARIFARFQVLIKR